MAGRARFSPRLHIPAARAALGPHVHFPRRRCVGIFGGWRAFIGDAIASDADMLSPQWMGVHVLAGEGAVELYGREMDPRFLGLYYATARRVSERPLFATPGWRRRFPAVALGLDALERRTRATAALICGVYAGHSRALRRRNMRRWFGERFSAGRERRLHRQRKNKASRRRRRFRRRPGDGAC
ncbi:hypothetical protein [Pseudocowpox virus]|uniref:Uncharacterized protein n=1 Tax=Pseudocowpox virus TaxID=129726 RepID=D3IZ90_9POXV|nr:hypothetical protein [Pseudocowpox virus]